MTDADRQKAMLARAMSRDARVLEAFTEIQNGPDPLDEDEVRALLRKRPDVYRALRTVLTPKPGDET